MSRPRPGSATPPRSRSATARCCSSKDGATHRVAAHPDGAILVAAGDGERLVTGGDDGRVAVTGRDGSTRELAATSGAWIDALALQRGGGIAWSAGKRVTARDDKGREKTFEAPSTVRGLAFAPKGYRLAMSHYNGATLWFPNARGQARAARMEGLASRRHLVAGRALRRHLDAGERAARLAPAAGQGPHAHVRLSGEDALLVVVA